MEVEIAAEGRAPSMTAIIILGAAVWAEGPSPTLQRRIARGAELALAQEDAIVVACGAVGRHGPSEAEVIAAGLESLGIDPGRIRIEDRSTNTAENLRNAKALLAPPDRADCWIVTDLYHVPRARLVSRRLGLRARFSWPDVRTARKRTFARQCLREVPAFLAYTVGWRG